MPRLMPSRIALPVFLTEQNKVVVGLLLFAVAAIWYLMVNHYQLFAPQLLPMLWIDKAVPFLPNTVWIYTSEYLLFPIIYLICKDLLNINKYVYSFLALQLVSCIIFWLYPTTYPRDQFPLPETLNVFTFQFFTYLRQTDSPACCFPSLHVSSVYLSSFMLLEERVTEHQQQSARMKKFIFFFLWSTAISFSTLTTKQHYFADIVSGFSMAVLMYWVFYCWAKYSTD